MDSAPRLPYLPALDGLRAVALALVLLFHSDFPWARGGHLGVTVFFVLSGFLITSLLMMERRSNGSISATRFWGRRARRLVPAALVCALLITVLSAFDVFGSTPGLLGDGASALSWLANWRFIFSHNSYADMFASPSPFQHFWSLAIEEQFYIVLPLFLITMSHRRVRNISIACVLLIGVAASAAASSMLMEGQSMDHAYYGTDARIAEPLVGALLAILLLGSGRLVRLTKNARIALDVGAVGALVAIGYLASELGVQDSRLYGRGFLGVAVLSAVVVAACVHPTWAARWVLSSAPLVYIGRISYGAYLFHWPIFLWLTERSTGLSSVTLLTLRLALTFSLAALSYRYIEAPIRAGGLLPRFAFAGWANAVLIILAVLALTTIPLPAESSSLARSPESPPGPPPSVNAAPSAETQPTTAPPASSSSQRTASSSSVQRQSASSTADLPELAGEDPGPPGAPPEEVASMRVVVLGDSVSFNLARGLSAWGKDHSVSVYELTTNGCPFSRGGTRRLDNGKNLPIHPACEWWSDPESDRYKAFITFKPDVVVIQDGVSELPDRKLPSWPVYRWPGDPIFDSWLRDEYEDLLSQLTIEGASVIQLNAVCFDNQRYAGWRSYGPRVESLNTTVYGQPVAQEARVADFNRAVCPAGRFSNTVFGVPNARPDGLHFTDEAALAIAQRWLGPMVLDSDT